MNAIKDAVKLKTDPDGAAAMRRAAWVRQLTQWHWISSAVSLVGILFFALSGITLNHADVFESSQAQVTRHEAVLPAALLGELNGGDEDPTRALPETLKTWVGQHWSLVLFPKLTEWGPDEIFVDLKRPGVDASLSIDRHSGAIRYEAVDRGWMAYFNELHRGRNAGPVWTAFITVFGLCCVVFSVTGLLILQVHARSRWKVWPVTAAGLLLPLLLMLLCIH